MRFTRARVVPVLLLALAGAGVVALQSPANAAVTTTNITTPINGTQFFIDDTHPSTTLPVSGTTNGTSGDLVDIYCFSIGSSEYQFIKNNVAVQANGSFSTTMNQSDPFGSCRLRAVPDGFPDGGDLSPFSGPVVTTEWVESKKVPSGPNAGKTYNYYVEYQGGHAMNDYGSATQAGLWDSRLTDAGSQSNYLWYRNADLSLQAGATRSAIQVDGRNAYGPNSAYGIFPNNPGLPSLTFSSSRNGTTGDTTITEKNPLVLCPSGAPYPPTAGSCPKFVTAGVRLERTILAKDGGRQVYITDVWRSTDGKSHTISPHYFQVVHGFDYTVSADTPVALKLPWLGGFETFSGAATYAGPSKVANTILVRDSNTAPDGTFLLPRGAITFDFPLSILRSAYDQWTMKGSTFTVPGGGYSLTRQAFVIGSTDAEVASKATANETKLNPYRADAQIKKSGAASFKGNNIYNTTGASQYVATNQKRSSTVTLVIAIQNDGARTQTFRIKGNGAPPGFSVKYLAGATGSTSITSSVIQGTYGLQYIAPGAKKYLRLVVTVKPGTSIGTLRSWLVTATPVSDATRKDVVKAIIKVVS